jgi:hypothetical protein
LGRNALLLLPRTKEFHESKLEADYRDEIYRVWFVNVSILSVNLSKTRLKQTTWVWFGVGLLSFQTCALLFGTTAACSAEISCAAAYVAMA